MQELIVSTPGNDGYTMHLVAMFDKDLLANIWGENILICFNNISDYNYNFVRYSANKKFSIEKCFSLNKF